jgi:hypothetical protein
LQAPFKSEDTKRGLASAQTRIAAFMRSHA